MNTFSNYVTSAIRTSFRNHYSRKWKYNRFTGYPLVLWKEIIIFFNKCYSISAESRHDLVPFEPYERPKKFAWKSFVNPFFHNFNAEPSELVYENFWSNILLTYMTFDSQNASICQGTWAYLHLSTVCRCECDTLPKVTILNVYNLAGFSVLI